MTDDQYFFKLQEQEKAFSFHGEAFF